MKFDNRNYEINQDWMRKTIANGRYRISKIIISE
jgi:hypothetical protein